MPVFFKDACPKCEQTIVASPACPNSFFCLGCKTLFVRWTEKCDECKSRLSCVAKPPITITTEGDWKDWTLRDGENE